MAKCRVFVDPGKWAIGWSCWDDQQFRSAGYYKGSRFQMGLHIMEMEPDLVVVECPVSYSLDQQIGDQNDLIQVALSAGACMSACLNAVTVTPGEWKGQLPKAVHHRRIDKQLTLPMRHALGKVAKGLQHNVLDAIALGLWWKENHPLTERV